MDDHHPPLYVSHSGEHFYQHPPPPTHPQTRQIQQFPAYLPHQPNGFLYPHPIPLVAPISPLPHLDPASPTGFKLDSNGWYERVSSASSHAHLYDHTTPLSPPGLPPRSRPRPPPVPAPPPRDDFEIHDFWKGRFAPFPGFSSRPGYLTPRVTSKINISQPTQKTEVPRVQLLPPGSPLEFTKQLESVSTRLSTVHLQDEISGTHKNPSLDKYADIFVPQYLKEIQKQPQYLLTLPSLPVYPPLSYLHSFSLPNLIEQSSKPRALTILSVPPPTDLECPPLQIGSYHAHWQSLLAWELDQMSLEKERIVLWKVGVKIAIWADAEFVLSVPGIRENHPRLEIGDLVHLREIYELLQKGTGMAFEGRVVALRKRDGLIHIHCPPLQQHILNILQPNPHTPDGAYTSEDRIPFLFNVSFVASARPSFIMDAASATMGDALKDSSSTYNLARHWLFPEVDDLGSTFSVSCVDRPFTDQDWIDPGLNHEQRLAVSSIALHQSPVPYLISGPPGTGKTRTVVEAVLQILRIQPEACILLCAPSGSATDTLALRLRSFFQPHEMLRLNDQNRTFAEVPIKITQFCYIENNKFALPPWRTLMKYRVVVCSCLEASMLVAAQCTNKALMQLEDQVVNGLHPHCRNKHQIMPHWTHLLIDEAAQGSEPELLVPMSVVLSDVPHSGSQTDVDKPATLGFIPQIVLCGDPQQLGPIVAAERARTCELDVSLLERLFERALYADHVHSRSRRRRKLSFVEVFKFTPFTHLVKNYRSHPAILMPPSAIFYDDTLEPCATNGVINWSALRNRELPLMFFGHEYPEDCVDERATWYNPGEIDKVLEVISSLQEEAQACSPPLRPADIGVMTPWREQVWKLRERLRNNKLSAVDVGTVEDYQGRESRVVIISCVRSNPRFLEEDRARGLGLVFEKKRMNVAITRAKELLVVIGNGSLLKRDPYWKGFLEFAIRNKLYVGPPLDLEMDGNYVSRLESDYSINSQDVGSEEDRGVMVASGIAREILSET